MLLTLHGIHEPTPGPRWQALFRATWPGYRSWYLSPDGSARPDLLTAGARLAEHMPELVPTYQRLVRLADEDPTAARMLTLWDAPKFLPGCSQVVLDDPEPVLIRNYDYGPDLWERVVLSSRFTGRRVIGTADCLWGLVDGMNSDGLAVSLAFGGVRGTGEGFAIPLVVRYLLEVAGDVAEARGVLDRLPIAMTYNLTMVDRHGGRLTAFVGPGRQPEYFPGDAGCVATNHRPGPPIDPAHAARFRSTERAYELRQLVAAGAGVQRLGDAFLVPPLHSRDYAGAFGTLYTAVYLPAQGVVEYRWPGRTPWRRRFDDASATLDLEL
jgi:predicted choloylglycine hydrolase